MQCKLFLGERWTDDKNIDRHAIYSCTLALLNPAGLALETRALETTSKSSSSSSSSLWTYVGIGAAVVAGLVAIKLVQSYASKDGGSD